MSKDWINDLRSKMEDFEEPAPEMLLTGIMGSLGQSRKAARRRRNVIRIGSIAGATAAAIALILVLSPETSYPITEDTVVADVPFDNIPKDNGQAAGEDIVRISDGGRGHITTGNGRISASDLIADASRPEKAAGETSSTGSGTGKTGKPSNPVQDTDANDNNVSPGTDGGEIFTDKDREEWNAAIFGHDRKETKRKGHISTDLYVANLTGSSSSSPGYGSLQPVRSAYSGLPGYGVTGESPIPNLIMLTQDTDTQTDIRHRQPIRTGITVRYSFGNRWGIETGLTYTHLYSRLESGGKNYSYKTDQTLHYIGIPLGASFDFISKNWGRFYIMSGGMGEKCISGKSVTGHMIGNDKASETTEKIGIRQIQWSVNASLGIQFNFTPFLGIYAEPGIRYYFNDGSPIETIYKEKPFNFDLSFGFRFTFR